jgi:hypothetical protein
LRQTKTAGIHAIYATLEKVRNNWRSPLTPIHLKWARYIDGIELRPDDEGGMFVPRSERLEPAIYDVDNLENPVAIHFMNANSPEALANFLGKFGMLELTGPFSYEEGVFHFMRHEDVANRQAELFTSTIFSTGSDAGFRIPQINGLLENVRLQPMFDFSGPGQSPRCVMCYACSFAAGFYVHGNCIGFRSRGLPYHVRKLSKILFDRITHRTTLTCKILLGSLPSSSDAKA